jgi:plasmid stabilization system protein ParE
VAAAIRIGQYPLIGFVRPTLAPECFRFFVVTGFPYVIVYRSTATPPRILRVLHGARDLPDALRGVSGER